MNPQQTSNRCDNGTRQGHSTARPATTTRRIRHARNPGNWATTCLYLSMLTLGLAGCSVTQVETTGADLGTATTQSAMLSALTKTGPIEFTKHLAATWAVPLSGLINLEFPTARAAGLQDRDEPIEIYVYQLNHPTRGRFIVDSGVAEAFVNPGTNTAVSSLVKRAMNIAALETKLTTKTLSQRMGGVDGVLLTHLHLDHIMGLTDLSSAVPLYVGPGDARQKSFTNLFTQGTTDRLLSKQALLHEWELADSNIMDVFDDGSLYAIHAPGHTGGTTAYLVHSTTGVQFILGDVAHTAWGWEHSVEPGTYSHDMPTSAASLAYLKMLASKITDVQVHPGHQSLQP